jgi:hypothetical protein
MDRRTVLQAMGVFVVTLVAGLPFSLQVGEWLAGTPGEGQRPQAPVTSEADPAPVPGDEVAQEEPGGPGTGGQPAGHPGADPTRGPQPAKVDPVRGGPAEAAPVEPPTEPATEPTGGPEGEPAEPPVEPTGEPEVPDPTVPGPAASGAPRASADAAPAP